MTTLSEIATELIDEHGNLRGLVQGVRDVLAFADEGDAKLVLVVRLGALIQALESHNRHEQTLLADVIQTVDAWGPVRRARMDEHHLATHARLSDALRAAVAASTFAAASRAAQAALDELATHMDEEERDFLNANVLRDDGLIVDQIGG